MTGAGWTAAAILIAFALLITIHQHRSTTAKHTHPQDGAPR